jgi:hypothetical protein
MEWKVETNAVGDEKHEVCVDPDNWMTVFKWSDEIEVEWLIPGKAGTAATVVEAKAAAEKAMNERAKTQ